MDPRRLTRPAPSGARYQPAGMILNRHASRHGAIMLPERHGAMTLHEFLLSFGVNPNFLAAGTAGGILRALSRRRFKVREAFASPICGALAAAYLTEPIIHYARMINWPLPPDDASIATQNAAAFLVGVIGMWVADIVLEVVVRLCRIKGE